MYGPATGPTPPYTPQQPYTPQPQYLPRAAAAPGRRFAARVGLFLLRAFLACLPIVTLGMLCWVPLVRIALVRRRARDWAVLVLTALLATVGFYMIASTPDSDNPESDAGVALMLTLAVACTVSFLVAELRAPLTRPLPYGPQWPAHLPAPSAQPNQAAPPAPLVPSGEAAPLVPLVPLWQVQAELEELSALLHQRERPAQ